jgi:hypothetical protein
MKESLQILALIAIFILYMLQIYQIAFVNRNLKKKLTKAMNFRLVNEFDDAFDSK